LGRSVGRPAPGALDARDHLRAGRCSRSAGVARRAEGRAGGLRRYHMSDIPSFP
jgi:hypothetical protein